MEGWRTYTPDGRMLEVELADGQWTARCGGSRSVGSSALEAIMGVVGSDAESIRPADPTFGAWLAEHAARLEADAG